METKHFDGYSLKICERSICVVPLLTHYRIIYPQQILSIDLYFVSKGCHLLQTELYFMTGNCLFESTLKHSWYSSGVVSYSR